jgi:hypothetical protein
VVDEVIQKRGVQDGGGVKLLSRDGRANYGKNSGTNYRANAKGGQRNRPKSPFKFTVRLFAIRDQFVDGLTGKKLVAQRSAPSGRNEIPHNETRKAYHAQ